MAVIDSLSQKTLLLKCLPIAFVYSDQSSTRTTIEQITITIIKNIPLLEPDQ